MIYNYVFMLALIPCQIWLYLCSIISLYLLWDLMYGLWLRVWWTFLKKDISWLAHDWLMTGSRVTNRERPREKHMLESKKSHARLDFASHSRLKPSCEWTTKLTTRSFLKGAYLIPLPTLYKPSLPTKLEGVFSKKFRERKP